MVRALRIIVREERKCFMVILRSDASSYIERCKANIGMFPEKITVTTTQMSKAVNQNASVFYS